jgi:hypothetical protein
MNLEDEQGHSDGEDAIAERADAPEFRSGMAL